MHDTLPRAAPAPAPTPVLPGLPVELTRLVGRRRELEEVQAFLCETRLLTLTGAGGSGKTRLAREVAAGRAGCCPVRFAWVELAPLADPELVPSCVAAALGLREEPGRAPVEALVGALGEGSSLLVLDNCEHVVDACAGLVDTLLRRCPGLCVLTTSREALGIAGERAWLVPPLSLPACPDAADPEAIALSEAVQLFVERAQEARPSFRLDATNARAVAQICHRLDGIPLAIELAAARVRVLAPEQIAVRLDDAFRLLVASGRTVLPRHRTLRETIEWSHRLLGPEEAALFRRLAAFAGSFSLEATEAVCTGPPVGADQVLDLLASLVDKSLVAMELRGGEARYRLLETVRQYARGRLEERGELEAFEAAHAAWYTTLAEEAAPRIFGGANDPAWIDRLAAEEANLRTALDWSEADASRVETGLRLGAAIHWAWFAWGRFREGRQRLERSLEHAGAARPGVRARAATALGTAALWQGDVAAARDAMEEGVTLFRSEGPPDSPAEVLDLAYALVGLGACLALSGDAGAAELIEESCTLTRTVDPCAVRVFALYWRGVGALMRDDATLARSSLEEAVAVGRGLGSGPATAHPLAILGHLCLLEDRRPEASGFLVEALDLHSGTGDLWGLVQVLEGFSYLAFAAGRNDRGARLAGAAAGIRDGIGAQLPSPGKETLDRLVEAACRRMGPEAFSRSVAWGRELRPEQATELARDEAAEAGVAASGLPDASLVGPGAARASTRLDVRLVEAAACCDGAPGGPAPEAPVLEIRSLGPLGLSIGGEPACSRCTGRARELLVFLACHPDGRTKDQVGLALWPEASPSQVRNLFHVTLHRLRKALGHPEWIVADGEVYRLAPGIRLDLDAAWFEAEARAALQALRDGAGNDGADPAAAAGRLAAALSLYRGDFLEGEAAGEWHLEPRSRLEELYLEGLRALGEALDAAGRPAEAADAFRRLLARDDLDEETHRRLLGSLGRAGDQAGVRRAYRRLVELLRRELDVEPEPETTDLFEQLVRAR